MNQVFESFGIGFGGDLPAQEFLGLVAVAEKEHYQSLWVQEGSQRSSLALSSAALQTTKRMIVGTGVTSPFRRHPQILAMEAATLNEISNGRFILGLGAAENSIVNYGLHIPVVQGMKDTFNIVRGILSNENFSYTSEVFSLKASQKQWSMENLPIYMGAIGPRMLDLAGEYADGLLITRRGGFSPTYLKYAIDRVIKTAKLKGRNYAKINFLAFFETSLSKNGSLAKQFIKRTLATYTLPQMPDIVLKKAGIPETDIQAVRSSYLKGDVQTAVRHVTDDMVETFALAGTPSECLEKLQEHVSSGLKVPILYVHGPDTRAAIELAARQVVPHLTENPRK